MSKTSLILINGLPGTGKTTLGKKIAEEFHLPFLCKDDIKELLFESLGHSDRAWSKKVGAASFALLYQITESILKANKSLIVETYFTPKFDEKKFLDLKNRYGFIPFQIVCRCNGEILFERFKARAESDERHPGHDDANNLDGWREILLNEKTEALKIGGEVFDLDTKDFESIDYNKLFEAIKSTTNIT
ncbi:MAG: ATP-binding protein [Candidatus Moranbacteria bacterium]|jgi:predicted kinase|nr:ATP-binding protein [Candidatus Moranbacteria bacterium]